MSQTIKTPDIDGAWPVISDGCTKIDAPMIVPTTIAVACGNRITLRSPVAAFSLIRLRLGVGCEEPYDGTLMSLGLGVTRIPAGTKQGQGSSPAWGLFGRCYLGRARRSCCLRFIAPTNA